MYNWIIFIWYEYDPKKQKISHIKVVGGTSLLISERDVMFQNHKVSPIEFLVTHCVWPIFRNKNDKKY